MPTRRFSLGVATLIKNLADNRLDFPDRAFRVELSVGNGSMPGTISGQVDPRPL
jgi:hypothetical protein